MKGYCYDSRPLKGRDNSPARTTSFDPLKGTAINPILPLKGKSIEFGIDCALGFGKIEVDGQTTVTAPRPNATLELIEGTGITLTNDNVNKTITITAAGGAGTGDVVGPASAVDERVAVFDGITGKLIKDGGMTITEILAAVPSVWTRTGTVLSPTTVGDSLDDISEIYVEDDNAPDHDGISSVMGSAANPSLTEAKASFYAEMNAASARVYGYWGYVASYGLPALGTLAAYFADIEGDATDDASSYLTGYDSSLSALGSSAKSIAFRVGGANAWDFGLASHQQDLIIGANDVTDTTRHIYIDGSDTTVDGNVKVATQYGKLETGNIIPDTSGSRNIGLSDNYYGDIFTSTLFITGEEINFYGTSEGKILFSADYTYDGAITLANSLKAIMNAHAADGAEHFKGGAPSPDTANFPVTEDDATTYETLVTLTNALQWAYASHASDGADPAPTYHNAQTAFTYQLASAAPVVNLYDIATRLNDIKLRYNQHEADVLGHTVGSQHTEANSDIPWYGFKAQGYWMGFKGLYFSPEDESVTSLGDYYYSWKDIWLKGSADGGTVNFAGTVGGSSFLQSSTNGLTLTIGTFTNINSDSDASLTGLSLIEVDTINEKTASAGVTIEGILLKDNTVTFGTDDVIYSEGWANWKQFTCNQSNDRFTLSSHGLIANDTIRFATAITSSIFDPLPAPITEDTTYYVKTVYDANTFDISDTLGGTVVNLTSQGLTGQVLAEYPYDTKESIVFNNNIRALLPETACGLDIGSYDKPVGRLFIGGNTTETDYLYLYFVNTYSNYPLGYITFTNQFYVSHNWYSSGEVLTGAGFNGVGHPLYRCTRCNVDNSTTDGGSIGFNAGTASTEATANLKSDAAGAILTANGFTNINLSAQELAIKLYSQDAEPTLTADNYLALWKDTNDSNRTYLIFKRGAADQIKVELT